jgi:hypothetical protein
MEYYSTRWDYGWLQELFDEAREGSVAALIEASEVNNALVVFFVINKLRFEDADIVIERLLEREGSTIYGIFEDVYILRYVPPPQRFVAGIGPSVYIYSHQQYVNTSSVLDVLTYQADYTIELIGSNNYSVTDWPSYWSFESITPEPTTKSIDANIWINFTGDENVRYEVSWTANEQYRLVGWGDDSFATGWTPRKSGGFTEPPAIERDGDILTITGNFRQGVRDYYWIWKPLNVSTNLYRYVLLKWWSTSTCAVAWVYYSDGSGESILPYGSYSADWTTTIVELTEGKTINYLMVGLDDYARADVQGLHSAYFDFLLLANRTYMK